MSGSRPGGTSTVIDVADDVRNRWLAIQAGEGSIPLTSRAAGAVSRAGQARPLVIGQREATPMGLARLFLRERYNDTDGRPLLVRWEGQWWAMRDGFYRELKDENLGSTLWTFLDNVIVIVHQDDGTRQEPLVARRAMVSEVADALTAEGCTPSVEATPPVWISGRTDLPPEELIVCPNGILHLPTSRFLPSDPDLFTPYGIDVPFLPDAPEPTQWLSFLQRVWGDEPDCIQTLRMIMGYALTADTRQQKIFLLVGPRRSGKGTIGRIFKKLVGERNVAAPSLGQLQEPFGLQSSIGKTLAVIGDARIGSRADQAAIAERLLSISGEDAVDINRKHLDPVTLRLRTRFLILSNELPRLADASGALASRFVLLTTKHDFLGREDKGLEKRILRELPGILNWAIGGWHLLEEQGSFVQPKSSTEALAELEELASPISAFLNECCEISDALEVNIKVLYERWKTWCKDVGRDQPGTFHSFCRDIRSVLPRIRKVQRRVPSGDRPRVYCGLGLR